jgi:hypothetical protein
MNYNRRMLTSNVNQNNNHHVPFLHICHITNMFRPRCLHIPYSYLLPDGSEILRSLLVTYLQQYWVTWKVHLLQH